MERVWTEALNTEYFLFYYNSIHKTKFVSLEEFIDTMKLANLVVISLKSSINSLKYNEPITPQV